MLDVAQLPAEVVPEGPLEGSHESAIDKLIAELWIRNRPLILERLAQLDETADAARRAVLEPSRWKEAESTAHKLSGCLGMFGFPKGTDIARVIEAECQSPSPNPVRLEQLATSLRRILRL